MATWHLVSAARLADAQLLVSELVTNAVRHSSGDSVRVDAYAGPDVLRVVVSNAGPAFDLGASTSRAGPGSGGWGLRIVQAVAHRCGVEDRGGCVRAWFEVDRPQRGTALEVAAPALPPPAL
jgi:anti-sigma regulatory factor (Ser/Thr protein kinase)